MIAARGAWTEGWPQGGWLAGTANRAGSGSAEARLRSCRAREKGDPAPRQLPHRGSLAPRGAASSDSWDKTKREEMRGGGETSVCVFRARARQQPVGLRRVYKSLSEMS